MYKKIKTIGRESDMDSLFLNLSRKKADLVILVLESQGIYPDIEPQGTRFNLVIPEADLDRAVQVLSAYYEENRFFGLLRHPAALPLSSFKSVTAVIIMLVLAGIHTGIVHYDLHREFITGYGSSALYILQGEYFRLVTALMLHADARHLIANCGGILIFAAPFLTLAGYGSGLLALLVSGAMGNLINAHFYKTAHLSIGASTFIMSAAGLLSAFQMITSREKSLKKIFPLAAGAALVSMFSGGENTDVSAHVFGFISGFFLGIPFFYLKFRNFSLLEKEPECLMLSLVIILAAWMKLF